jgi:hypothetical protein
VNFLIRGLGLRILLRCAGSCGYNSYLASTIDYIENIGITYELVRKEKKYLRILILNSINNSI